MKTKFITITSIISIVFLSVGSVVNAQTNTPSPSEAVEPTTNTTPTTIPTFVLAEPAIPQGVTAVAIDHSRVDITWKKVANADTYEVYRNNELVAIFGSLLYSDEGLDPETTYSYKVRAFNGFAYSGFSTIVSVTTKAQEDRNPEPTLPEDPDVSEKAPTVFDNFSFVMIGSEKRDFSNIGEVKSGEDFVIYGKTENYADIEIVIESSLNSIYTKADDKGFWEAKVNTSELDEGEHNLRIIISADNFPEKYESDEFEFEIVKEEEGAVEDQEDNSFASRVSRIVWVMIVLVVIAFAVLAFVAYKKGWINRLLGKGQPEKIKTETPDGGTPGGESAPVSSLEEKFGDIQIEDHKTETKTPEPAKPEAVADPPVAPTPQTATEPVSQVVTETIPGPKVEDSPKPLETEGGKFKMETPEEEEGSIGEVEMTGTAISAGLESSTEEPMINEEQDDIPEVNLDSGEMNNLTEDVATNESEEVTKEVPDYSSVTDAKPEATDSQGSDAEEMVVGSTKEPSSPIQFGSATSMEEPLQPNPMPTENPVVDSAPDQGSETTSGFTPYNAQ